MEKWTDFPHPTFSTRTILSRKSTVFILAGFHLSISSQRPQTYVWINPHAITTLFTLYLISTTVNIKYAKRSAGLKKKETTGANQSFANTYSELLFNQLILFSHHGSNWIYILGLLKWQVLKAGCCYRHPNKYQISEVIADTDLN